MVLEEEVGNMVLEEVEIKTTQDQDLQAKIELLQQVQTPQQQPSSSMTYVSPAFADMLIPPPRPKASKTKKKLFTPGLQGRELMAKKEQEQVMKLAKAEQAARKAKEAVQKAAERARKANENLEELSQKQNMMYITPAHAKIRKQLEAQEERERVKEEQLRKQREIKKEEQERKRLETQHKRVSIQQKREEEAIKKLARREEEAKKKMAKKDEMQKRRETERKQSNERRAVSFAMFATDDEDEETMEETKDEETMEETKTYRCGTCNEELTDDTTCFGCDSCPNWYHLKCTPFYFQTIVTTLGEDAKEMILHCDKCKQC